MAVDIEDLELIANKLNTDFNFYRNKKIFLTGGTGFFGKWLLESFIHLNEIHKLNITVTVISRAPKKFLDSQPKIKNYTKFKFIKGDVRTFTDFNEEFDLIIHAATDVSVELNKRNPSLMKSTIIDGAKNICKFADSVNCKRILYTSSGAAYGPQPENLSHMPETFTDNPQFNPNDAYASGKLESEKYFKKTATCDVVIARCFAFAGPYLPLDGTYAFGNFINDILNDRNIVIKGSGNDVRSYLYAADLIIWLLRLLSIGQDREIYNVGSPESIMIKQLALKISNGKKDVIILNTNEKNKNVYLPDTNKSITELGVSIYTPLSSAILKTIRAANEL